MVDYPLGKQVVIKCATEKTEYRTLQEIARRYWDLSEAERIRKSKEKKIEKEPFVVILQARLALVHPMCVFVGYGQGKEENDVSKNERDRNILEHKRKVFKSRHGNGVWRSTTRMDMIEKSLQDYLASSAGNKAVIFSEYLCQLHIVEVALGEHGA